MAGHGLLLLLDDIAALLDDIALLSKTAAKKTAGVLGDDLALNAQQVTGIRADRELPVIWAVAKGSFLNKLILVPAALVISAFIPWLITPLLIMGGLFLCYEGVEKILHSLMHRNTSQPVQPQEALSDDSEIKSASPEKQKIKGAIRTDFILSAEIIAITLGVVASEPLITQAAVLSLIAILITVVVYGLVAGIVRLDDWGLYLSKKEGAGSLVNIQQSVGMGLLQVVPYLMKGLSFFGTAAMFLVGGGILSHGIPFLHHLAINVRQFTVGISDTLTAISPLIFDGILGVIAGLLVFFFVDIIIQRWILSTHR
ncbi:MAG: putative DNA repair protein MutK [Candidatus Endobugula sp.]|jgi:predicted DNA repair protein MutK